MEASVPAPASALQPLSSLKPGAKGAVVEINLPAPSKARLMEMGLLTGTQLELLRFAPMGDPLEIRVRGYNLSLRKHEADQIMVRPSS